MKRPKDMTQAELDTLPVGAMRFVERPLTLEDYAKGLRGKTVMTPIEEQWMVTRFSGDDILGYRSSDGQSYTFGQYADGSWYRELVFL